MVANYPPKRFRTSGISPRVYPSTRYEISSGDSSPPSRFLWIKSTVRIMKHLAYHLGECKVKDGLRLRQAPQTKKSAPREGDALSCFDFLRIAIRSRT